MLKDVASGETLKPASTEGLIIEAARPGHAIFSIPRETFALTSDSAPIGDTAAPVSLPDVAPIAQLLGLVRRADAPRGAQAFPIGESSPLAAMQMEGAATPATTGPMFKTPSLEARPHRAAVRLEYSRQSVLAAGPDFEGSLRQSMTDAMTDLRAAQLVAGSGVAPQVVGLANWPGIQTVTYAAVDKGGPAGFLEAEGLLDAAEIDARMRHYVLATDVWQGAKQKLREPGDGQLVLMNGLILSDIPAIRTSALPAGTGLLIELSKVVFVDWPNVELVVDTITQPGTVKLTAIAFFDTVLTDADAVVSIAEA